MKLTGFVPVASHAYQEDRTGNKMDHFLVSPRHCLNAYGVYVVGPLDPEMTALKTTFLAMQVPLELQAGPRHQSHRPSQGPEASQLYRLPPHGQPHLQLVSESGALLSPRPVSQLPKAFLSPPWIIPTASAKSSFPASSPTC